MKKSKWIVGLVIAVSSGLSAQASLKPKNGYFIKIGNSAEGCSKYLALFARDSTSKSLLMEETEIGQNGYPETKSESQFNYKVYIPDSARKVGSNVKEENELRWVEGDQVRWALYSPGLRGGIQAYREKTMEKPKLKALNGTSGVQFDRGFSLTVLSEQIALMSHFKVEYQLRNGSQLGCEYKHLGPEIKK